MSQGQESGWQSLVAVGACTVNRDETLACAKAVLPSAKTFAAPSLLRTLAHKPSHPSISLCLAFESILRGDLIAGGPAAAPRCLFSLTLTAGRGAPNRPLRTACIAASGVDALPKATG